MKKATLIHHLIFVMICISSPGGTGKAQKASGQNGDLARFLSNHGNSVYQAGGLLCAITKNEELVLAEASRAGYHELSRFSVGFDLGRPQQPTIANGRLYLRGNQVVAFYQVAGKTP